MLGAFLSVLLSALPGVLLLATLACSPPSLTKVTGGGGAASGEAGLAVAVDEAHVFEGEINRRGKPVGFHSRSGGRDPANARLKRVQSGPNRAGVYTAQVEIRESAGSPWQQKFSSIFPDSMSREEVLASIRHAYEQSRKTEKWSGPSGKGFTIEGYFQQNQISTAYPIYKAGE